MDKSLKLKSRLHLNSKFRPYVSGILLLISLIILSHQASRLSTFIDFDVDDFVEYWSASILHIQGHNPYDQKMLTSLQNEVGRFRDVPVIMWNPPWTLALILPFGLLEFSLARFVWFLAHVGVVLVCSAWLWKLYGGSKHSLWIAWLLALTFGPILIMLKVGQISGLFLLGVVGFLYLEKMNKDFFAGVLAAFIMIKPHIGLLFIIILVIWAFHRRKWRILLGVATALTVATAIVTVINPSPAWRWFRQGRLPALLQGHHPGQL